MYLIQLVCFSFESTCSFDCSTNQDELRKSSPSKQDKTPTHNKVLLATVQQPLNPQGHEFVWIELPQALSMQPANLAWRTDKLNDSCFLSSQSWLLTLSTPLHHCLSGVSFLSPNRHYSWCWAGTVLCERYFQSGCREFQFLAQQQQ